MMTMMIHVARLGRRGLRSGRSEGQCNQRRTRVGKGGGGTTRNFRCRIAMTARRCDKPEDETEMEWYAGGVEPIGGSGTRRTRTRTRMVLWAGQAQSPGYAISSLSLTKTNIHTPHCLPNPRNILWCVSVCVCVVCVNFLSM